MVIRLVLPEWFTGPSQEGVRSPCRKAFDRLGDPGHGNSRLDNCVDVIGHDAKRNQEVQLELLLAKSKSIDHTLRDGRLPKPLRAGGGAVQLTVGGGEGAARIGAGRVAAQTSIGPMQTPREEDSGSLRVPMRKIALVVGQLNIVGSRGVDSLRKTTQAGMPVLLRRRQLSRRTHRLEPGALVRAVAERLVLGMSAPA